MIILHVCEEEAWKAAQTSGAYRAARLETEGFILCSRPEQVVATTERYYKGRQGLVLLVIDDNAVDAGVKFEMAKNGEAYPHLRPAEQRRRSGRAAVSSAARRNFCPAAARLSRIRCLNSFP